MARFVDALVLAIVLLGHAFLGDWLSNSFKPQASQVCAVTTQGGSSASSCVKSVSDLRNDSKQAVNFLERYPTQSGQVISGLVATLLYMTFLINQRGLRRFRWIRRRILLPLPASYEGYWASMSRRNIVDHPDQVLTTLSKIYYSKSLSCWIHHGFEFNQEGVCIGEFRVESIHFSATRGIWFFRGQIWEHETGPSELYSEKYQERDQISFISLAPKLKNHIVSRYFDDPISAGKSHQPSGRAAMIRIDLANIKEWFPDFEGAIEHPTIRVNMTCRVNAVGDFMIQKLAC